MGQQLIRLKIDFIEPEFSKYLSVHIFKIFQEALSNVASHAQAEEVNTEINYLNGDMVLSIEDNGRGLTQKRQKIKNHLVC